MRSYIACAVALALLQSACAHPVSQQGGDVTFEKRAETSVHNKDHSDQRYQNGGPFIPNPAPHPRPDRYIHNFPNPLSKPDRYIHTFPNPIDPNGNYNGNNFPSPYGYPYSNPYGNNFPGQFGSPYGYTSFEESSSLSAQQQSSYTNVSPPPSPLFFAKDAKKASKDSKSA